MINHHNLKLLDVPTKPIPIIVDQYKQIITPEVVHSYFKEIAKEIINRYKPKRRNQSS